MCKIGDGDMTVDYGVRCVVQGEDHDVIFYGIDARDYEDEFGGHWARDLDAPYAELSRDGRRPGERVESHRHFFNKRIQTDEERQGQSDGKSRGHREIGDVSSGDNRDGLGARDREGSTRGIVQTAFSSTVTGGSDRGTGRDYTEEDCPGHVASPDDPEVCDRCGAHIDSLRPEGDEQ